MTSEAAQAFAAWFHQMTGGVQTETGGVQPGQDQAAPESAAPSYPVVSDGGEPANVQPEGSVIDQFTDWFYQAL